MEKVFAFSYIVWALIAFSFAAALTKWIQKNTNRSAQEGQTIVSVANPTVVEVQHYYVNKNAQLNGEHEVHQSGCPTPASEANRLYLGNFSSCHEAVQAAKKHYSQSNGCAMCSPACHTS